jgi:hypothetical protein
MVSNGCPNNVPKKFDIPDARTCPPKYFKVICWFCTADPGNYDEFIEGGYYFSIN